jgi:hypothetical protein
VRQEVPQEVRQEVRQEEASLVKKDLIDPSEQQTNALELIKSALEQINFALQLLEGIKKPPSYLLEKVAEISEKVENIPKNNAATDAVTTDAVATDAVATDAVATDAVTTDHVSDVEEEVIQVLHQEAKPVRQIIEEEFKIVLPKKSKNKKASNTMIISASALEKEKKDDFPSLGSSFTPIKKEKTGFWREGKKSLEIAKAIAHIPSPTPTSSPSPYFKVSNKNVRGSCCLEEENNSDNDEFQIRKCGGRSGDDDEEYWQ